MNLDPLKPYADLLKVGALLVALAIFGWLSWSAGANRWKGKHDQAEAARAAEVQAHADTKKQHAEQLDGLAKATAAVAAKAKAASEGLASDRKVNDERTERAEADARQARADLRTALRRGDVQLQAWWTFDPAGAFAGDPADAAGGEDGFADLRTESLLQGVQDGYDADAWIGWLQTELTDTRRRVIEAGCAVEASP